MTPSRWDSSPTRSESYERCGYFGIKSFGSPGSKDEHAHGTAQSGLGLYFALLQDAECSLCEIRNLVFIYKHSSSVFLIIHTPAQNCHQIAKAFF